MNKNFFEAHDEQIDKIGKKYGKDIGVSIEMFIDDVSSGDPEHLTGIMAAGAFQAACAAYGLIDHDSMVIMKDAYLEARRA